MAKGAAERIGVVLLNCELEVRKGVLAEEGIFESDVQARSPSRMKPESSDRWKIITGGCYPESSVENESKSNGQPR